MVKPLAITVEMCYSIAVESKAAQGFIGSFAKKVHSLEYCHKKLLTIFGGGAYNYITHGKTQFECKLFLFRNAYFFCESTCIIRYNVIYYSRAKCHLFIKLFDRLTFFMRLFYRTLKTVQAEVQSVIARSPQKAEVCSDGGDCQIDRR